MPKIHYSLTEILLSAFSIKNNIIKKRLIYNHAYIGGINSKWIKLSLFILPFAMYAAVFNPTVFKALGIAQAIVFYIILLVVAMQIVVGVSYFNNKKVIKRATKLWEEYFPDIDFNMILSSGVTPYSDFKKHFELALNDGLKAEELTNRLKDAFMQMENENSILVEAMRKDQQKKKER
ncbi:MAG: hypothetical protein DRQ78_00520 [Epsilonproteobacteria bacterium]|nr:MAG: hypothetical protein DRQ78_00520 [Campylobacterota bacterium]